MSEQEKMFRAWIMTLIAVLNGFTMASMQMELVGEGKRMIEVLMEEMLEMMGGYTPEQRQVLASELAVLSGLANRIEPSI